MDLTPLNNLITSLQAFNASEEFSKIVDENSEQITILQKEQLLEGKDVEGKYLRPFYSEDPYFKTPLSAKRYADWKSKISPNKDKPFDVPDLFITGKYVHDPLFTKVNTTTYSILVANPKGQSIIDKYPTAAGLDEQKRLYFATNVSLPGFLKVLKEKTGLKG